MATGSSAPDLLGCKRMSDETVLDKMKNGYRNNDRLNSKNTISFKDGAER